MQFDHHVAPRRQRGRVPRPHVSGLPPEVASLADVINRLQADFAERLDLATITATVCRCRRELDIIHSADLPELTERIARQRLQTITARARYPDQRR